MGQDRKIIKKLICVMYILMALFPISVFLIKNVLLQKIIEHGIFILIALCTILNVYFDICMYREDKLLYKQTIKDNIRFILFNLIGIVVFCIIFMYEFFTN